RAGPAGALCPDPVGPEHADLARQRRAEPGPDRPGDLRLADLARLGPHRRRRGQPAAPGTRLGAGGARAAVLYLRPLATHPELAGPVGHLHAAGAGAVAARP